MKKTLPITLVALVSILSGCHDDARTIWKDGIRRCAENDLLGPNILFFGPSNGQGPGTIYVKYKDGSIGLSHLSSEYLNSPDGIIVNGLEFACGENSSVSNTISGSLDLSKILSVPTTISGKLSTAKSISVKTDSLQWVELVVGPYKALVNSQPPANSIRSDLVAGQLVLTRALKVKGMSATLEFSKDKAAALKINLPQNISGYTNSGINFSVGWESDSKLVLTSKSDFYIAGELRHYENNGLASDVIGSLVTDADQLKFYNKQSRP